MTLGVRPADYGSLTDAEVRQVLSDARGYIEALVHKLARFTPGHDEDDLRSVAEMAALEAHLTYEPDRGRAPGTWAYQVISWRLEELRQDEVDIPMEAVAHAASPAPSPESRVEAYQLAEWLEANLARLSPRRALVLARRLHGETGEEVGSTLGLSRARISQVSGSAERILRLRAKRADGIQELARSVLGIVD